MKGDINFQCLDKNMSNAIILGSTYHSTIQTDACSTLGRIEFILGNVHGINTTYQINHLNE